MTIYKGFNIETGPVGAGDRLKLAAAYGANLIRYQIVSHDAGNLSEHEYLEWVESEAVYIAELCNVARNSGVYISVDLHSQYKGLRQTILGGLQHEVIINKAARKVFVKAWKLIAMILRNSPNIHSFGLLNEPRVFRVAKLISLYNNAITQIHEVSPWTKISVSPAGADPNKISSLGNIKGAKYYEVHMYSAMNFTHQGLGDNKVGVKYPTPRFDAEDVRKLLNKSFSIGLKHKKEIFVGEYGVVRWADEDSAVRWFKDVLYNCEVFGFHTALHSLQGCSAWNVFAIPAITYVPANPCEHVSEGDTERSKVILKHLK